MKKLIAVLILCAVCVVAWADNSARINEVNAEILNLQQRVRGAINQRAQLEQGIAQAQNRLLELNAIKGELVRQDKEKEPEVKE